MHLASYPALVLYEQLHQCCTIDYGEGRAITYLIYEVQREHMIFLITLGGRQVRIPYTLLLGEESETWEGE